MAKDTKKNKVKKEKKESKTFFKDFKAELKKVTWPTAKQLANKTTAVIVIVIIIAAIVFALDFAFGKGYEFLINKTSNSLNKDKVNENNVVNEEEVVTEDVGENAESTDLVVDADTTDAVTENAQDTTDATVEAPAE